MKPYNLVGVFALSVVLAAVGCGGKPETAVKSIDSIKRIHSKLEVGLSADDLQRDVSNAYADVKSFTDSAAANKRVDLAQDLTESIKCLQDLQGLMKVRALLEREPVLRMRLSNASRDDGTCLTVLKTSGKDGLASYLKLVDMVESGEVPADRKDDAAQFSVEACLAKSKEAVKRAEARK